MTTSISSEARRNQTSILIRGRENHLKPDGQTDRYTDGRTEDISIYREASLLITKYVSLPTNSQVIFFHNFFFLFCKFFHIAFYNGQNDFKIIFTNVQNRFKATIIKDVIVFVLLKISKNDFKLKDFFCLLKIKGIQLL